MKEEAIIVQKVVDQITVQGIDKIIILIIIKIELVQKEVKDNILIEEMKEVAMGENIQINQQRQLGNPVSRVREIL